MGFFGFGKTTKVDKLTKKLRNAYSQTSERHVVMQQLAELGTEEAMTALLQRFTYRTEASIVDEDEKETAYRYLVRGGDTAVAAIEAFLTQSDAIYWPVKALKDIAGIDRAVEVLLSALDRSEVVDQRVNEQKTQIVSNLRDFPHPEVQERLQTLSDDDDEDIRILAIDGLLTYGPEAALPYAARRLLDEGESLRVKTVILEQLIELDWSLSPWQAQIEEGPGLPVPYELAHDGKIRRV